MYHPRMPPEERTAAPHSPEDQEEILRRMEHAGNYNTWLLERAQPYLGERVLDAGAGTGTFTEAVADNRELVVAMEPEERFAARLEQRFAGRPNVLVLRFDIGELAHDDRVPSPFDSIICFNVLEHVADDAEAVASFGRVLAPGGHLLLLVPAHPSLFGSIDRTVGHERRYRKHGVRQLLETNGLEVVDLRLVNPLGALGWLVSSRIMRRPYVPEGPLLLYDRLVPLLRALDRFDIGFGLSVWAVGRRAA
jgi:SAM-dependent methyltransferase